jgi:hypothetical protein
MEKTALDDFGALLAEWAVKLMVLSPKFDNHLNAKPVDPCSSEPVPNKKKFLPIIKLEDRLTEAGLKKTKPIAPLAYKFALTQGPEILYDGESQALLFEFWSSVSLKRGTLRKENDYLKRAKTFLMPAPDFDIDDEINANNDALEVDDESDDEEHWIVEERQQAQQRENSRRLMVFEHVNSCVERALDACEKAAFLWLKGAGCAGHVVYISSQLNAAVDQINAERKVRATAYASEEDRDLEVEPDAPGRSLAKILSTTNLGTNQPGPNPNLKPSTSLIVAPV